MIAGRLGAALLAAMLACGPVQAAPAQASSGAGGGDIFTGFNAKSKDPIQVDAKTLEIYEENKQRFEAKWGTWPPHKTRPWVTSPLEDPKISLAEFFT